LLRREVRAAFNDDLPDLLSSLENIAQISLGNSVAAQRICKRVGEIQTMVARANRLLHEEEEQPTVHGVSTTTVTSTYPREIILYASPITSSQGVVWSFLAIEVLLDALSDCLHFSVFLEYRRPHQLAS